MIRYFIIVFGRVQGVGFRFFVNYTAVNFNLTGWVRNCDNGTVQMEVQGKEEEIRNFIEKIKKGNGFIRVEDISMKKIDVMKDEKSFKVKY
ncbi:acylphosphatase [Clostridium ganghwense]|uniref:Acylphosphatase n=1 Tax=Clostridium ganghwense TaxID=312089 RepID=A0ABT4CRG6_9CLOT|nr:acylphosphatase [Clostridium ganghwense]MCY6370811.1 acylphosphatase [Clostridium ganghwense]